MSKRKKYSKEFKQDAVRLVTEQGYSIAESARNLGLNANMLARWKKESEESRNGWCAYKILRTFNLPGE